MMMTPTGQTNVPNFLIKLWTMTNNAKLHVITWDEAGTAFVIHNQLTFVNELLPRYFKHGNMQSFVSQLHLYGFRKVSSKGNNNPEYKHKHFQRGRLDLLELIKRKSPKHKRVIFNKSEKEEVSNISKEVASLSQQLTGTTASQDKIALEIAGLQRENRAIVNELRSLEHNHLKQTQQTRRGLELLTSFVQTYAQNKQEAESTSAPSFTGFDPDLVEKLEDIKRENWEYYQNECSTESSMVFNASTQRSLPLYSEPTNTMDLQNLRELVSCRDMLAAESSQAQRPLLGDFSADSMDLKDDNSLSPRFEPDESNNVILENLDKEVDMLLKSVLASPNSVSITGSIIDEQLD